jgi:hypothetical protein
MIRHAAMRTSLLGAAPGLPVGIALAALATRGLHTYGLALGTLAGNLRPRVLDRRGRRSSAPRTADREAQRSGCSLVRVAVARQWGSRCRSLGPHLCFPRGRVDLTAADSRCSYVAPVGNDVVLELARAGDDEPLDEGDALSLCAGEQRRASGQGARLDRDPGLVPGPRACRGGDCQVAPRTRGAS